MNPLLRLRAWLRHSLREPRLDLPLLGALILLALIGLATLYSASDLDRHLVLGQALRFALGGLFLLLLSRVPPNVLRNWTPWLYFASLALLVAVALIGQGRGANRWLNLGVVRFQPSELVKLTLPMMIAWYLHARELPPRWLTLGAVALLIVAPTLLIAK
ncbi:MAG TPA: FtsW/RodA/SpoVE family cell cycle protein, partial [Rudaea sp.]|nr:FtsW/RodA/SpoVE family cell cycle protein [Rudaea sp.]